MRDKSQIFIHFQAVADPTNEWFDVGLLRRVLETDHSGISGFDEAAIDFLKNHLDELETIAADDEQRLKFVDELTKAQQERAIELE